MRLLVVASFNRGRFAPFIIEQAEALKRQECEIEWLGLQGKGIKGYLKNYPLLQRKIKSVRPDIIHAHYGLSGLLANLQRSVPVVTTYHGSDINDKKALPWSKMAMHLSAWNIFVSKKTLEIAKPWALLASLRGGTAKQSSGNTGNKYTLLPCGIDLSDLQLTSKVEARQKMHLEKDKKYVLFAGAFDNAVKNAPLAQETVAQLHDGRVELLELKGYTREEVTLLMCAADAFLMTSHTEGSPQVVKEAMACGCPIVSVDVGDVKERVEGLEGCFVANSREPKELSDLLVQAMSFEGKTQGREKVIAGGLDNELVAKKLIEIYHSVVAE